MLMSVVNVLLVFGFTIRFKKKVDFVVQSTKTTSDSQEEQELYLSVHTIMVQNLNRKYKVHKTQALLNDLFRTVYDERLVKVTIVPELRSLDYIMLKQKEYKLKMKHFQRKNQRTNTRYAITIKRKGVKS